MEKTSNRIRLIGVFITAWLLASCATQPMAPQEPDVDARVRQPAQQDSAGVQVFPLENPAVTELLADASAAESNGQFEQASMLLERALRIQPRNPEILQSGFYGGVVRIRRQACPKLHFFFTSFGFKTYIE